jgi:hypothetical protein|tara:strand:- start:1263 stop:1688 length:426 start_codon:yes stop_codon:yes gene_type:complete
MSKLLNSQGIPIEKEISESGLPSREQLLKDPITEKFVFLESENIPNQTCIGLTEKTKYNGVVYKYGKVTLPDESTLSANKHLNLKFDYDILDTNGVSKEILEGKEFHKLIGDILYHVIITQAEDGSIEPDNRADDPEQFSS